MKKQLLLIFLILVSWAQTGTIVTHYDLDGNLISEEFQQAIDANLDSMISDVSMPLSIPDTEAQQLFEIEPNINKSPEQETSSEYQQYQEQEKERQEQLQEISQQDNLDWSAGLDQIPVSQLSDKQEESTSLESDSLLQPTVASQDSVINIQETVEEPQDVANLENQNSEQSEDQATLSEQPPINEIPETSKVEVPDMPTQQISDQVQEQNVESINQTPEVINQEQIPDDSKVQQVENKEVENQEIENQETITVEQLPTIQQDMIPTEEEEENLQPSLSEQEIPKEGEVVEQEGKFSQIEEDIKFDANQSQGPEQNQEVQKQNEQTIEQQSQQNQETQKALELPLENPVQEISQDFPLAKEQEPEQQVQLNENTKLANQIQQSKCIIIYSQCDYQGYALEACDSLQQIEQFKHEIKSIYIPQGYGLTIYENENFNGHSHRYTSSQSCLQKAVSFIQIANTLSRQNLRQRI